MFIYIYSNYQNMYIYILIPPGLLCFNVFLHMSANSVPGFLNPNQWVTSRRKTRDPGQAVRLRDMRVSVHLMPLPGALTKEPPA